jgi:hypothetical protein
MIMGLEEPFLHDCRAHRDVSQQLWSLKSCFLMVMELEEPFLINYGSKKGVSQWLWI